MNPRNIECLWQKVYSKWASLIAQSVKNLPAVQETQVQSLGREDLLEKEMATHSSTLAWKSPWTVAYQAAPPSMEFSRQEYWSGLPFSSPGDLPDSGTKPESPALQADALPSEPPGKPKNTGVDVISFSSWSRSFTN